MSTETIFNGHIVRLEVTDGKWEVVRHADAVSVLALDSAGRMLCVRQHRRALGQDTIEVPAGLIDPGEEPLAAARRELQEEAGFDADLELLTRYYSSPGFSDEQLYLYRATSLRESRLPHDEDEDIEVLWLAPAELLASLKDGSATGSATSVTAALYALLALGQQPQP